ncbi:MAG: ABC transporter permease [Anaerovoracaceae bacterium]
MSNIKKNAKGYIPYMLTCVFTIALFYIMIALATDPGVSKLVGGESMQTLLGFGVGIAGIFSAIFLFYTNSFLIKGRSKEIAVYNILGMEKGHIGKVLFLETIMISVSSLIAGVLSGIIFGKLAFLLALKLLRAEVAMTFPISVFGLILTAIVFGAIFFIVLLCNLAKIKLTNPINLLSGGRQGEKEPKTKIFMTLIGLILLGAGYGIALSVESPITAMLLFFIAVILVIIGTYFLFTAGSIALLKMLKKNKKYYYNPSHFVAISGMFFRMKKNAAGLASICILSTMVIVTIGTTVCLQLGATNAFEQRYTRDINVTSIGASDKEVAKAKKDVLDVVKKHELSSSDVRSYTYYESLASKSDNNFFISGEETYGTSNVAELRMIPINGTSLEKEYGHLNENQVIVSGSKAVDKTPFSINGKFYEAKPGDFESSGSLNAVESYYIMVADQRVVAESYDKVIKKQGSDYLTDSSYNYIGMNIQNPESNKAMVASNEIANKYEDKSVIVDIKTIAQGEYYAIYGGFLFIGVFLGTLFLIAAVLIIYYKQISEGNEDRERYKIMQQVGMSFKEVRYAIKSQILIVFFLPLAMAIVHVAVSFNMMTKLLATLQLTDVNLFAICTGITVLVFAIIYIFVYSLTAKEYYKIVK